jgi:DNA-binding HxlR family transcriptional regulator
MMPQERTVMWHSINLGTMGAARMAQETHQALRAMAAKRQAQPCGVETTLSVIEGRWKLPILFQLLGGTLRFGQIRKRLPGATQRMLTLHLRELERDGLIHREVYREVPPKVEYSLTELGRSLEALLRLMSAWGHGNRAALVAALHRAAAEQPALDVAAE